MSKVTVALGSLIIGLFIGSGIHTSIWAQSIGGGGSLIDTRWAIPTVPPLRPDQTQDRLSLVNGDQVLDGLNCTGCSFDNMTFTYSGGAFFCKDCTLGAVRVNFQGAAANAIMLKTFLDMLAAQQAPKDPNAHPPAQEANPKIPIKATWVSPAR